MWVNIRNLEEFCTAKDRKEFAKKFVVCLNETIELKIQRFSIQNQTFSDSKVQLMKLLVMKSIY